MKRRIFSVLLLAVISMLLVLPASAAQTSTDQQIALEIAALINEFRAEKNLYQLVYNTTLESVAQKHTAYQVSIEESTHYGEGRSTSKDRVTASGYGAGKYIFASEIIYHGMYATPEAAMKFWKNSQIHFEQMTSIQYHEFGVAVGRSETTIYYTVNFAAIRGVTAPGVGSAPVVPTPRTSAPVTPASPNADGSIVHSVKEGQTIQGIAEAYQVPLERLLLYNGLTQGSALSAGQLILVKLPASQPTVVVEETQSPPEPTLNPAEVPTEDPSDSGLAEGGEVAIGTGDQSGQGSAGPSGIDERTTDQGGITGTIIMVAVGAIVVGGAAGFAYFRMEQAREESRRNGRSVHPSREAGHDLGAFHHRQRAQQYQLLREVAEMALDAYPLEVVSIRPLRYVLNAEFMVSARPQGGTGEVQQFMMRVNAPRFHSRAEIGSEMEWLAALHRDTDLKVPVPVQTSAGEWVQTVNLAPVGEPLHCALFRILPGQSAPMKVTPGHFEVVGAVIARLHKHGAGFVPPSGFSRKHWDLEGLKGGMLDVPASQAYQALMEDERKVVDAAEKVVGAAMEKLGINDEVYGLIHGDLHLDSFQYHDGQPQILDFDTCGYGYYIYDLSVMVWDVFDRDDFSELKSALLHGYRTEQSLSEEEEQLLMHFVAGRLMTQALAWAGRRDDPNLSQAADNAIEKQIKQLVTLLRMLMA